MTIAITCGVCGVCGCRRLPGFWRAAAGQLAARRTHRCRIVHRRARRAAEAGDVAQELGQLGDGGVGERDHHHARRGEQRRAQQQQPEQRAVLRLRRRGGLLAQLRAAGRVGARVVVVVGVVRERLALRRAHRRLAQDLIRRRAPVHGHLWRRSRWRRSRTSDQRRTRSHQASKPRQKHFAHSLSPYSYTYRLLAS